MSVQMLMLWIKGSVFFSHSYHLINVNRFLSNKNPYAAAV